MDNKKERKFFLWGKYVKPFLTYSLFYFVIKSLFDVIRGIELTTNHLLDIAFMALIVSIGFTIIVAYFNKKENEKRGVE